MKYVIERQYLRPVYQRLVIEADSVEDACEKAIDHDDWEDAEEDGDGARATTISGVREMPDAIDETWLGLGEYLWCDEPGRPARAEIPSRFSEE